MRMNIRINGGYALGSVNPAGTAFTGPVYLGGDPTAALQAVTKNYADTTISAHTTNAAIHTTSVEKTLLNGITVSATEINQLVGVSSSVQIQINNKLSLSGGSVSGAVTLAADPVQPLEAATKQYVDSFLSGHISMNIADIISKPYAATPTGFLKCNGAYVSQATYAGLFSKIGHFYEYNTTVTLDTTYYNTIGSGKPWKRQFEFLSSPSSAISSIAASGITLPAVVAAAQSVVTKNRVYLLGGHGNGGSPTYNSIYTAPINADGTLGAFTTDANVLPNNLAWSQVIVTKNRVYLLGGSTGSNSINAVYTALINADGTLGTFTNSGITLPSTLDGHQAIVTKNRVYLISGATNIATTFTNQIYVAPINADGTLGAFTTDTNTLPASSSAAQIVVIKNKVYFFGGYNGSTLNTIYVASINSDGTLSAWNNSGITLPVTLGYSQIVALKDKIYIFGGYNGTVCVNTVYVSTINADGTITAFTNTGLTLPAVVGWHQTVMTKNHIYLLGGYDAASSTAQNYVTAISISGLGLNDYTQLYNGNINKFDGIDLSGTITIFTNNPDINTYFKLPDMTARDFYTPGSFSFIKY